MQLGLNDSIFLRGSVMEVNLLKHLKGEITINCHLDL